MSLTPSMNEPTAGLLSCPECGTQMPSTAAFCPGCGCPILTAPKAQGKIGILPRRVAGALAYLTFIPPIVFLLAAPYRHDRFVRFHSIQCLLLCGAGLLVSAVVRLLAFVLLLIPMLGILLVGLISTLLALAACFLWLILVIKALQGESFQVPVLGVFAEHYSIPV
jgi:uncharacterized membrane protein